MPRGRGGRDVDERDPEVSEPGEPATQATEPRPNDPGPGLALRQMNEKLRAQEVELAELREKTLFVDAELDHLSPEKRKALMVLHGERDLSVEALRETAEDAGWALATRAEMAGLQRIAEASSGAVPQSSIAPEEQLRQAMAEGGVDALMAKAEQLGLPTVRNM